jgi:hypothetical protein
MASAVFCLCTRQFILGMLMMAYGQMQLSEMIIWFSIDHAGGNERINRLGTRIGKVLLASHNLAVGLGLILSRVILSGKPLTWRHVGPALFGAGFLAFVMAVYYSGDNLPADLTQPLDPAACTAGWRCRSSKNRLQWPYEHDWYGLGFLLTLSTVWAFCAPWQSVALITVGFTLTFACTMFLLAGTAVGSFWCFTAAVLSPALAVTNWLIVRGVPSADLVI